MRTWFACVVLAAPAPLFAVVVEAPVPALPMSAPLFSAPAASLGAAARLSPSLSAAPALSVPALAPSAAAAPVVAAPVAAAPAAVAPAAAADAIASAPAAAAPALSARASGAPRSAPQLSAASREPGSAAFDGARSAADAVDASGWSVGSFESAAGGSFRYKARLSAPERGARVYAGGLALNESFDPLFASQRGPTPSQFFLWTRGHPPTGWVPTETVIDADARDLARMINAASDQSGAKKVELALHSFGTLVFQRLIQLRGDPEVDAALKKLSGSRVTMLNATTHYNGSERRAGAAFESMGNATRTFVDWLNAMDAAAAAWKRAVAFNPMLAPLDLFVSSQWGLQRDQLMGLASRDAAAMMRKDLGEAWPAHDEIRQGFLKDLARDSRNPGWQESLLRRSSDMFRLEFTPEDVAYIRRLGIRLELIHAAGDQLLNWESARILFERLGIAAPDKPAEPGATFADPSGRFRATIVAGDHYFPLKQSDKLAGALDP